MSKIRVFLSWLLSRDWFRFILVGVTAFAVDFGVNALLFRGLHWDYRAAFVVGVVVATGWAFLLNKVWAFQDKSEDWTKQTLLFFAGRGVSLVVTYFLQVAMVEKGAALVPEFLRTHPIAFAGLTVAFVELKKGSDQLIFNPLIAKMINGFVNFAINYAYAKLVVFRRSDQA